MSMYDDDGPSEDKLRELKEEKAIRELRRKVEKAVWALAMSSSTEVEMDDSRQIEEDGEVIIVPVLLRVDREDVL